jgi:type IV pilus biogenesis protein PilP
LFGKKTTLAAIFSTASMCAVAAPGGQTQGLEQQIQQQPAMAQQSPAQTTDGAPVPQDGVEELSVLQTQIAILKAKAEIAKLNSEIRANDSGVGSMPIGVPAMPPGVSPSGKGFQQGGAMRPPEVPVDLNAGNGGGMSSGVALISGYDGKFAAKIQSDSGTVSVEKGSTVSIMGENWTVLSVSTSGVDLTTSGKHPKAMHMGQ